MVQCSLGIRDGCVCVYKGIHLLFRCYNGLLKTYRQIVHAEDVGLSENSRISHSGQEVGFDLCIFQDRHNPLFSHIWSCPWEISLLFYISRI